MPKHSPRYYKKRSSKKRRVGRMVKRLGGRRITRNKQNVLLGLGFPKKMTITHRYNEVISVTSTTGVLQKYQFSCNGMYDPNITGTGHQPMYFDQLTALYDHYTVIGAKAVIKVIPSTNAQTPMYVGAYIDDDTTTTNVGNIAAIAENSLGKIRMIPQGKTEPCVFSLKWSPKKIFGGSILGNDNLSGTVASNPTEQSYFTFGVQADGSTTGSVLVDVAITYIAVWDELKEVAQS